MNSQSGTSSLLKPYYYIEQKAYLTDWRRQTDKERVPMGEALTEEVKKLRRMSLMHNAKQFINIKRNVFLRGHWQTFNISGAFV